MSKYENGKIYKIVNDELNLTYYGSTISTLTKRLSQHKAPTNLNSSTTSKILFSTEIKPKIYLVELFPCNLKIELLQRERYYIENNDCINKTIPSRTAKEWREDNKDELILKSKEYRSDNKEVLTINKKIYYEDNKEKICLKSKEYRSNNKEIVSIKDKLRRNKEKITCLCGSIIATYNTRKHEKTKKHLNFII